MSAEFLSTYPSHVERLVATLGRDRALSEAVGGNFVASGTLQYFLLRQLGLSAASSVIDVGCGSGRLAAQLASVAGLRYMGTEVVPELIEHARRLSDRPDWSFHLTNGVSIPAPDEWADFICFFSVLTHLKHEESFRYLREAKRALRPGGQIVISFLEFAIPSHWEVFDYMVNLNRRDAPLNQFMDRAGLTAFAQHLDLLITAFWDGGVPHIPIPHDVHWDDGRIQRGLGDIGHSIVVLAKPMEPVAPSD